MATSAAAARVETPVVAYAFGTWRSAVPAEMPKARKFCVIEATRIDIGQGEASWVVTAITM